MSGPLATLIIAQGVLVLTCFLIGFLVGVAIWRERDSRRIRRYRRDLSHAQTAAVRPPSGGQ